MTKGQTIININPEKILLIQLRRIGDVLMTTPAVRTLKNRFPQSRITFLTEEPSDEIFRHSPYVDEVLLHHRNLGLKDYIIFIKELRKQRFDLVIDFFSNPGSAKISFLSGARYRIGFNFRLRAWAYTSRVNLKTSKNPYSPFHKLLLLKPLGIEDNNVQIEFFCSQDDYEYAEEIMKRLGVKKEDFIISLCPVSRRESRVWQAEKFAWIADKLIEKYGARILFIWGPDEKHFITDIKAKMKYIDKTLDNYEIHTISQVRALYERVDLGLTTDNGLRHIAIAANTPTVTVFGQGRPDSWTPPESKRHKFVDYDPGCKTTCNLNRCKDYQCINGVSEIAYLEKIEGLIKELEIKYNHLWQGRGLK